MTPESKNYAISEVMFKYICSQAANLLKKKSFHANLNGLAKVSVGEILRDEVC